MDLPTVWKLSDQDLRLILKLENQELTADVSARNFDRVMAATILYNHGKLDTASIKLVKNPNFNEIMSRNNPYNISLKKLESWININPRFQINFA